MVLGLRETCPPPFTPGTQRLGELGCSTQICLSQKPGKTAHGIEKLRQGEGERLGRGGSVKLQQRGAGYSEPSWGGCPQGGEGKTSHSHGKRLQSLAGAGETE